MPDDARRPVIVGVGQINDRPEDPEDGLDSLQLMEAALRRAEADAGGPWLGDIDRLCTVDQISCPDITGIADRLAGSFGATRVAVETTDMPHGDSPVRLLDAAATRIAAGEETLIAIVGAEALRTAASSRGSGRTRPGDILRGNPKRATAPYRQAFGITAPVDLYPFYENACRFAWGQTLAEAQAETGAIWSRMSEVAVETPSAWLRRAYTAEEIVRPTPANRLIAHPYTKFMVANASVNQGAGFIVTSVAEARRRGVPDHRMVHVGLGAGAAEPAEFLDREGYDRSVSMEEVLKAALEFNAIGTDDLDHVELYSCFPCMPKMARRVLDWPLERPVTVFGGLTFGGAPVANYMSHAIACMVARLRGTMERGLLYGNGGIVTTNHAILLSGAPLARDAVPGGPDAQARADARRGPEPGVVEDHVGPVRVESWTVRYDLEATPKRAVMICRTDSGARTLAEISVTEELLIKRLTEGRLDPIGRTGRIETAKGFRRFAFD